MGNINGGLLSLIGSRDWAQISFDTEQCAYGKILAIVFKWTLQTGQLGFFTDETLSKHVLKVENRL